MYSVDGRLWRVSLSPAFNGCEPTYSAGGRRLYPRPALWHARPTLALSSREGTWRAGQGPRAAGSSSAVRLEQGERLLQDLPGSFSVDEVSRLFDEDELERPCVSAPRTLEVGRRARARQAGEDEGGD
jgi:hypothetical protein